MVNFQASHSHVLVPQEMLRLSAVSHRRSSEQRLINCDRQLRTSPGVHSCVQGSCNTLCTSFRIVPDRSGTWDPRGTTPQVMDQCQLVHGPICHLRAWDAWCFNHMVLYACGGSATPAARPALTRYQEVDCKQSTS
jgi:hypothetical protein